MVSVDLNIIYKNNTNYYQHSMIIINENSSNDRIKAWQVFLNGQGIDSGNPDGLWGINTENATKKFQMNNGISADGKIGQNTIAIAKAKGFVMPKLMEFNPAGNLNAICDISHLNENVNLEKAKAGGMSAVFHKATQSSGNTFFRDKAYPIRRQEAKNAGLLWGAYHFGAGGDGTVQANDFLSYTMPNDDTLMVLDFERNTTQLRNGTTEPTMNLEEASAFVSQIKLKTGKYPGIYGGALLRESLRTVSNTILSECWLWIAQYAAAPKLPNGWSSYTFWQFTDGVHGPGALPVPGIGPCDRDVFKGNESELISFWKEHQV